MLAKSRAEVTVSLPSDREMEFVRIFDYPRDLVFQAWTKPQHIRQWWGCHGAKITILRHRFEAWRRMAHCYANGRQQ